RDPRDERAVVDRARRLERVHPVAERGAAEALRADPGGHAGPDPPLTGRRWRQRRDAEARYVPRVAGARRTDLLGRLADLSEEAIQRLSDAPGADRALSALNAMRDRTDELQKRVRGLEDLEKRLAAVERKVDKLAKSSTSAPVSSSRTSRKTT